MGMEGSNLALDYYGLDGECLRLSGCDKLADKYFATNHQQR